ncbi:hypothetical protein IRZ59_23815 [Pseudomonas guariconensis]|uniref:hypothetical protein n=1 Tax=Pseudomonas guariconensis TaxID=1288410 RepID=UPI0018AA8FD2|nr:hypothetical protein [Pseudomonas guariconensis]MBF8733461.1 hypothetical protein [Pseudomonas guariconensis]
MYTKHYLLSLLRSLLVGALLGAPTVVSAESTSSGGGLDTSALAMYQRPLSDSGLDFGLHKVEKSTAFLIDSGNDAAPALLVGSGHAVLDVFDQVATQLAGIGLVRFRGLPDATFEVAHVRYASRRGLDFAIFELHQTQGALKALGVTPLALAGRKAIDNETVIAATRQNGVSQGVASWPEQALPWIDMLTGEGTLFRHLLMLDDVSLHDGDSGSPIVDAINHGVLAVVHSSVARGAHAADLSFLPACLHQGRFSAEAQGCGLGNVFNVEVEKDEDVRLIYKQSDQAAMLIDSSVYSTTSLYQAKLAQWPEQCEESDGYGAPQASGAALNLPLEGFTLSPTNPTVLALCIWGLEPGVLAPANRNAVALPVVVHQSGPAAQPKLKISTPYYDPYGGKTYRVRFPSKHLLFRGVEFKLGPWQGTDCANPRSYGDLPATATGKIVVRQDTRLCAVGIDHAGQRSVPVEVRLQP